MAALRLPMRKLRELLRLKYEARLPQRAIAQACGVGLGTVTAYLQRATAAGLSWPLPIDLDDTALEARLFERAALVPDRAMPVWADVQQELKRNHDNPGAWAGRLIGQAVYGEQPCGWDVGGSVELVQEMQRPDFVEHIGAWYRAGNVVLSVAGNVTHEMVLAAAEPFFLDMESGALPALDKYDSSVTGERVVTDSREIDQCTLYIGSPIFGRDDPDRFALRLMNDVLGAGMSSRLFREVREKRGLAYSVSSGYGYLSDAGVFTISAGVNREQLAETITVCIDEAQKLCDDLVPPEELRKAKDHNIGRFRLSLETAFSLGQRNGELLISKNEIESVDSVVAQVEAVTADQVRAVAQRLLGRDKMHVAAVGPKLDDDELAKALGM